METVHYSTEIDVGDQVASDVLFSFMQKKKKKIVTNFNIHAPSRVTSRWWCVSWSEILLHDSEKNATIFGK